MEKDVYFYISLKIKSMSYHHPLHYVNEAHFIERLNPFIEPFVGGWGGGVISVKIVGCVKFRFLYEPAYHTNDNQFLCIK